MWTPYLHNHLCLVRDIEKIFEKKINLLNYWKCVRWKIKKIKMNRIKTILVNLIRSNIGNRNIPDFSIERVLWNWIGLKWAIMKNQNAIWKQFANQRVYGWLEAEKKEISVDWARISIGIYKGDIAKVERLNINCNEAHLKLFPRVNYDSLVLNGELKEGPSKRRPLLKAFDPNAIR